MSGRPYARNPRAPHTGLSDLEAILPHTFRLQTSRRPRDAKYRAVVAGIRRQCRQKNWRKMISVRRRRQYGEVVAGNDGQVRQTEAEELQPPTTTVAVAVAAAAAADVAAQEDDNDLEEARNELVRLEQKLQELTEQKHAKFQLLKGILVEEAKSKMTAVSDGETTGTPASKK
ncbi:unnamed protein product [Hyaloperonospora brassicae]|uniref:Uncharacterized protein n=1 Tax=Hyaloperonospora brassicae TaxID=162125 RepID=A0AAV0TG59_HYABA|nr:unnamed protein product [Hyaloperonospora brassicae]